MSTNDATQSKPLPGHPEGASFWTALRGLPRPAWILFFGTFVNKFGSFVVPFLALYMTRMGYSLREAGVAIGACGVGNLLASGVGGYLADTIGRRKTIALSMGSAAVAMMLLSQARSFPALVLLAALVGLTAEFYRPASSALLADLVPPGQRVAAFAAYRLALNAGWAFGPATAGFLAEHSFFWLFLGDAVTSLLFGVVAWVALPRGVRTVQAGPSWRQAVQRLAADRRFLQVLLASLAVALVFFQMSSSFGLHVTHHGFSGATYGALLSLNGVLIVLFEIPLTAVTSRFPARPVMALGYVLIGTGFALNAFAITLPALLGVVVLFTIGEMISMPVSAAYVADLTHPDMRGRYMGAYGFTWALALTLGPAIGLVLFEYRPALLWFGCGGLGWLAALVILAKTRSK